MNTGDVGDYFAAWLVASWGEVAIIITMVDRKFCGDTTAEQSYILFLMTEAPHETR